MEQTRGAVLMTASVSVMHAAVDFMCALALFGRFFPSSSSAAYTALIYNACAFALQMPLGILLDALVKEKGHPVLCGWYVSLAGVLCTLAGCFTTAWILGIGNALFHVGGGVCTYYEDRKYGWGGRGLGIFVAPGAIGLYLGMVLGKAGNMKSGILPALAVMIVFALLGQLVLKQQDQKIKAHPVDVKADGVLYQAVLLCFLVVVLRSFTGFMAGMEWKKGFVLGLVAVLCVAGGKAAGGFLYARFGKMKAIWWSLGIAAIAYLLSGNVFFGCLALFMFNITMPVTLYELSGRMPGMPGCAFGILTFALFIGYLPKLYGMTIPAYSGWIGAAGSLVSALLLQLAIGRKES